MTPPLTTSKKIIFINLETDNKEFSSYVDDFIEDIGNLSDNYTIKRPPKA